MPSNSSGACDRDHRNVEGADAALLGPNLGPKLLSTAWVGEHQQDTRFTETPEKSGTARHWPTLTHIKASDGHSRRGRHAVRLRRYFLAANGLRHRVDGRPGVMGDEPARRIRPCDVVRHRTAFARNRRAVGDRAAQDAAALERRGVRRPGDHSRGADAGAGHSCRRRRSRIRGARRRRQARISSYRQRHVCHPRMAQRRRRRPRRRRQRARRRHRLRSDRLHRQAR